MRRRKISEDIASEPYIAHGDDASGDLALEKPKRSCSYCLEKGGNIT